MAKRAAASAILPLNAKVSSESANTAKRIFDALVEGGMDPALAWHRAGELLAPAPYTAENHIGIIARGAFDPHKDSRAMMKTATARRAKSNGAHHASSTMKRIRLPEGKGWEKRFARGLIRWRLKEGMEAASAASMKYGIQNDAWSRTERAVSPGFVGKHANEICEAIGEKMETLLILGTPE